MAKRFEKAKEYTEKYKAALLPCRFCHNTDVRIVSDRGMSPPRDEWSVVCMTPKCDCSRGYTSVKAAVAAWNEQAQRSCAMYNEQGTRNNCGILLPQDGL